MLRKVTLPTLSVLCLAMPLTWAACSSSSSSGSNPTGHGDAGNNTNNPGDGDGDGDGDTDTDASTGNGSNGDGDSTGDGDANGDGDTGNGGSGGAGGSSNGSGGMGPGLAQGDVNCLGQERPDLMTAFYFGYHQLCTSTNSKEGMLNETQTTVAEGSCTTYEGMLVDACSDENVVAYCFGDWFTAGGILDNMIRVYEGPVTPDAAHVARNAFAICGALPVFDLDDNLLTATCSGTVTAMVDDALIDFSENLVCTFRTDGTQSTYLVRATNAYNTLDSKELTLKIIQDANGDVTFHTELNAPGFGYLEGATGFGAYAFTTDNTDPSVEITSFSDTGEGLAGTFTIGELSTAQPDNVRVITDGNIDIQFTVE